MNTSGLFCTTSVSGTTWSREWKNSSGTRVWLEQGGKTGYRDRNSNLTITLPKAFSNTNYTVIVSIATNGIITDENDALTINSITTTSFGTFSWGSRATLWYACGK